jgi:hypothetical protein
MCKENRHPNFQVSVFSAGGLVNLSPLITRLTILYTSYGLRPVVFNPSAWIVEFLGRAAAHWLFHILVFYIKNCSGQALAEAG